MAWRRSFAVVLSVCLLGEGFCAPAQLPRLRRADGLDDNEVTSKELTVAEEKSDTTTTSPITSASTTEAIGRSESSPSDSSASGSASPPDSPSPPASSDDDDDDDDFADLPAAPAGGGGGSNLFSLLNLAGSLFPSSSGNNASRSPGDPTPNPLTTFKSDIFRAFLQFVTSLLGSASSAVVGSSANG